MYPIHRHHHTCLMVLCLTLMGALALPMVPVWEAAIRLVALAMLYVSLPKQYRLPVILPGALALIGYAGFWCLHFIASPAAVVLESVTDVYGAPIGIIPNALLLAYDMLIIVSLMVYLLYQHRQSSPYVAVRRAVWLIGLFWLATLCSTAAGMVYGYAPAAALLAGTSTWAIWVVAALLVFALCHTQEAVHELIKSLVIAGTIVTAIVVVQWLLRDFSYVIDSLWFNEYYNRARGTYYYYSPAMLAVAMTGMLALAFTRAYPSRAVLWYGYCALTIILVLFNGSRGLALACGVALAVAALFFAMRHRWILMVATCIAAFCVTTMAMDYKPVRTGFIFTKALAEACDLGFVKPKDWESSADDTPALSEKFANLMGFSGPMRQHSARNVLLKAATPQLKEKPLLGTGIGDAQIPLGGNSFNGITSTYSSHILYLDIALMAGIPALLLLCAYFAYASIHVLLRLYRAHVPAAEQRTLLALIMALAVFGVTGTVLGQEQDHLRTIGFVIAACMVVLSAVTHTTTDAHHLNRRPKIMRLATGLFMLGAIGWSVLTSTTYIFPVAEFVGTYRQELKERSEPVYVNNAVMGMLVEAAFKPLGITSPVIMLEDDVAALPKKPAWVIWSRALDVHYPKLRCDLGYRYVRKNMQAPSISFPSTWWLLPNVQNVTMFMYTGKRDVTVEDDVVIAQVNENIAADTLVQKRSLERVNAIDANFGSYMPVRQEQEQSIDFDVSSVPEKLTAYRLYPQQYVGLPATRFYDWKVEVSMNGTQWNLIDRQTHFPLQDYISKGKTFFIKRPQMGKFVRITLRSPQLQDTEIAGIAEIELYTGNNNSKK